MSEKILALKIWIPQTKMHFCIFDSPEAKATFVFLAFQDIQVNAIKKINTLVSVQVGQSSENVTGRQS